MTLDEQKIKEILLDRETREWTREAWIYRQEIRLLQMRIQELDSRIPWLELKIKNKHKLDFMDAIRLSILEDVTWREHIKVTVEFNGNIYEDIGNKEFDEKSGKNAALQEEFGEHQK